MRVKMKPRDRVEITDAKKKVETVLRRSEETAEEHVGGGTPLDRGLWMRHQCVATHARALINSIDYLLEFIDAS